LIPQAIRRHTRAAPPPPSSDESSKQRSTATTIDGDLDKAFWNDVEWTEDFVDIATESRPRFRTRAKMRWDDDFLYIGRRCLAVSWRSLSEWGAREETDVWGTLTEHNSVIFHDNDFEIFVDAEGSNHNYKEFEINSLGTTWSLLLNKPYDDGGGFDMEPQIRSAVKVFPNGVINQPAIRNTHWTIEVALPISKLIERNPLAKRPADGVFWRVNFSRVQWGVGTTADGRYEKRPFCQSCATPGSAVEDNWVWSKQGEVAMHLPERWGILQFQSEQQSDAEVGLYFAEWPSRCAAMAIYYAMKAYHGKTGVYVSDIGALKQYSKPPFTMIEEAHDIAINLTANGYEASVTIASHTATVNEERYLVVVAKEDVTAQVV
ncbi:hypothetical protein ACHAW5_009597, partial [Stephanodiscus triporus]